MEDIQKLRTFNKLKSVYRANSVENRKESSAEHSWSSLMLADYFLSKFNYDLDKLKVYELLMYHDLVEIKSGDFPLDPTQEHKNKREIEEKVAREISKDIPEILSEKYLELFKEFEECNSKEAKFAKAIDKLDAEIHEMDYKEDWKGWSKEFLIKNKLEYFNEFPEMEQMFYDLLEFFETNGYFDQN